jgi:hypothetical protein
MQELVLDQDATQHVPIRAVNADLRGRHAVKREPLGRREHARNLRDDKFENRAPTCTTKRTHCALLLLSAIDDITTALGITFSSS